MRIIELFPRRFWAEDFGLWSLKGFLGRPFPLPLLITKISNVNSSNASSFADWAILSACSTNWFRLKFRIIVDPLKNSYHWEIKREYKS